MKHRLIIGVCMVIILTTTCNIASAWLPGWDYRIPIEINNTGNNLTDFQYDFTGNTATLVADGKMQANGNDCNITDSNGNPLSFWNQTAFNTSNTQIWVNATSLDNVTNTTHYMYYGKSDASSAASISDTFDFGVAFNIDTLVMVPESTNPTRTPDDAWEGACLCEQSDFNYSGEYISWYRGNTAGTYEVGFENSTDGIAWNGYSGNPILSTISCFPYVVQNDNCFYMFVKRNNVETGGIFLYNVTDYTNPVIMNSGVSVLNATEAWESNTIYNVAVDIDGDGRWHMLYETSGEKVGYTYSNLTEMNWTAHKSVNNPLFTDSGNAYLKYVPERNALLVLMGYRPASYWTIKAWTISLSDDLNIAANWISAPNFEISHSGVHTADPHAMFNFNSTYPTMISYNYNQAQTYQAYSTYTLNEFFDTVTADPLADFDCYGTFSYNVENGILSITTTGTNHAILKGKTSVSMPHIIEARSKVAAADDIARTGFCSDTTTVSTNQIAWWWAHITGGNPVNPYVSSYSGGTGGLTQHSAFLSKTDYHNWKVEWISGSKTDFYFDDVYKLNRTTNIPTTSLPAWIYSGGDPVTSYYDWVFVRKYAELEPVASLGAEESAPPSYSIITVPANSWGMFNNWTDTTTFANIAANESNNQCLVHYNTTSGIWESYVPLHNWNANYQLSKDASVMGYFNAETDITSDIITPTYTNLPIGWNMLAVQSSSNRTLSAIKSDIGINCSAIYYYNSTANAYLDTSSHEIPPNCGYLGYITNATNYTRTM